MNELRKMVKEEIIKKLNENKAEKVKVLKHLIKRGDNPKDAKKDVEKLYNKVNKMYKSASPSKKAEIISALSAKMESVNEIRKFHPKKPGDDYMGGENTSKGDTEMFADKKGRYYVWVKPKGKKEKYIDLPKNIKRGKADDLHLKIQKTMGESVNERMDKRQAGETLKQLGGNKFIAMTGAKQFSVGPKGMGFRIGRNAKSINYVRIDLKSTDLYDMEFIRIRGSKIKVVKKVTGVYNDQLQKMFTKYTGMYTSL